MKPWQIFRLGNTALILALLPFPPQSAAVARASAVHKSLRVKKAKKQA